MLTKAAISKQEIQSYRGIIHGAPVWFLVTTLNNFFGSVECHERATVLKPTRNLIIRLADGRKSMTHSKATLLLFGFALTFLFIASEKSAADIKANRVEPLNCAYTHTINLGHNPHVTQQSREKTRFELHIAEGLLAPDFCDEVVKAFASGSSYYAFCETGQSPAKITHDIVMNKASGEIVTIMNFYADRDWVTKLAHYGVCEIAPSQEIK